MYQSHWKGLIVIKVYKWLHGENFNQLTWEKFNFRVKLMYFNWRGFFILMITYELLSISCTTHRWILNEFIMRTFFPDEDDNCFTIGLMNNQHQKLMGETIIMRCWRLLNIFVVQLSENPPGGKRGSAMEENKNTLILDESGNRKTKV